MNDDIGVLAEFEKFINPFTDNEAVLDWKNSGKKVIAFECTYVPEEIIYAAGALPIRLVGDTQTTKYDEANAYMYQNTCSFIRNCLQLVLKKQYNFLDGFVAGSTCDCSRRLADVWEHYRFTPFIHTIGVPRKISPTAYELYEIELRNLMDKLAEFTGPDWEQEDDVTFVSLERELHSVAADVESDENNEGEWLVLADFSLPSEPGNERLAMEKVTEAIQHLAINPDRLERLRTAVAETALNAMEHGNKYQPFLITDILIKTSSGVLKIYITDHGGGRPIPESVEPNLEAKLAGLQSPRGWGLFLIKNMVDEMHVHTDEKHHTVELIMKYEG